MLEQGPCEILRWYMVAPLGDAAAQDKPGLGFGPGGLLKAMGQLWGLLRQLDTSCHLPRRLIMHTHSCSAAMLEPDLHCLRRIEGDSQPGSASPTCLSSVNYPFQHSAQVQGKSSPIVIHKTHQ